MKFYCDGSSLKYENSKTGYLIGWGSANQYGTFSFGSRDYGTNINAEMLAIKTCLEKIYKYNYNYLENIKEIEIITDSKTSLQIISGYMKDPTSYDIYESENYKIASEIDDILDELFFKKKISVKFSYIKGHEKNIGNNFADYIATTESKKRYFELTGVWK